MEEKYNFSNVSAIVADADQYSIGIVTQILRGFGLIKYTQVDCGTAVKNQIERNRFDLIISDIMLPDMSTAELAHWLRRLPDSNKKYIPVIVLTGYTNMSNVLSARDAGVNCVVKKPAAPNVLFDHIVWAAKTPRPFIESNTYIGPCRRFKNVGPPSGVGRRSTDLSAEIGEAKEPNLSQDEIDAFIKPTKVTID